MKESDNKNNQIKFKKGEKFLCKESSMISFTVDKVYEVKENSDKELYLSSDYLSQWYENEINEKISENKVFFEHFSIKISVDDLIGVIERGDLDQSEILSYLKGYRDGGNK